MKVNGSPTRTIWPAADGRSVEIIDQTKLPFEFETVSLETVTEAAHAIYDMLVRGAPLIGATAAYGMALAMKADPSDANIQRAYKTLFEARPTAVNLRWAIDDLKQTLSPLNPEDRFDAAWARAAEICDEDVAMCSAIGDHGKELIQVAYEKAGRSRPVNVLTHCNAGWLATVDWGTAIAPIYKAFDAGIPIHVWVDETRPRNQGASLTAWELHQHGVPHTVIADNAGGHLMQHGKVDLCIVGTDRTTRTGDVCNKIGTYLKALAAHDNKVPFYVALPGPTIDWTMTDGYKIPIEERDGNEVTNMRGLTAGGEVVDVRIVSVGSKAVNPAFDVTPAHLVTKLITERGVCEASEEGLRSLYPEHKEAWK
ncbi:MAG: S-methyl-5-thioribose-1-phosphate isomerase [Alphaproteobacteria bacterium]|nr:S-methyl-5-thioribose-1-phosphate isomerase [Alphaproteobacteria bacterium]